MCGTLKSNFKCSNPDCNALHNSLLNFPTVNYDFWPETTIWDSVLTNLKNLTSNVTDWFKKNNPFGVQQENVISGGRKLLGSSSLKVVTAGTTSGYDVIAAGDNSGVKADSVSGVKLLSACLAVLMALF